MILTTTSNIEGRPIEQYLGIVTGEAIIGADFLKDFMAAIKDLVGGRAQKYEETLIHARKTALSEIEARAAALGANAIVGLSLDYESLGGDRGGMMMVTATGTAVLLQH